MRGSRCLREQTGPIGADFLPAGFYAQRPGSTWFRPVDSFPNPLVPGRPPRWARRVRNCYSNCYSKSGEHGKDGEHGKVAANGAIPLRCHKL